jgi:histidinol-phosphatase (PHP family)
MTLVALTEHLPLPSDVDDGTFAMDPLKMDEYFSHLEEARRTYHDIEILFGTEIDWRWKAEDYILKWLARWPFELRLGSVHMLTDAVGNQWEFDHPRYAEGWNERGEEQVWRDYLVLWKQALASAVPFDIMTHPDLPKKLGYKPRFDTAGYYAEMAEAARAAGVMIEVNTSGLHKPVREIYPAPALLKAFCEAGVPCSVNSDAHSPSHVGRDFDKGYAAMRAAGYTHMTVPTRSGDRREIPLN